MARKNGINQELSKTNRLTRRQIDGFRLQLARQMSALMPILAQIASGEKQATAPQVAAIGKILDRVLPGVTPQDLEQITNEPKTETELVTQYATALKDTAMLDKVIQVDPAAAVVCRDHLISRLPTGGADVIPIERVA